MGEAKKRGTFDERKSGATLQQEDVLRLFQQGQAPHYAFIVDRSKVGMECLAALKKGPDEIRARVNGAPFQMWESMSQFEFVVLWGSWGYSGGLTLPTANLEVLLHETIPAAVKRTHDKGGLCLFGPFVDEKYHDQIMRRIAELQPTASPDILH